jgi:hypothetical protein
VKVTNIKKIVIWALVILNVFFLGFYLWGIYKDRAVKNEVLSNLSALFERYGIALSTENIREGGELAELKISRDIQLEQKLAESVLGLTERTDQGGGIYIYTGTNGRAEFKNGGTFSFKFNGSVYGGSAGAENTAKSILQTMGIVTDSVIVTGEPDNERVGAVCAWERRPIFNARISFLFKDGSLAGINGTYAANTAETGNKTDMSSCATSLMAFLNEVKNDRISCTQITGVSPGYYLEAPSDSMVAVWSVHTETGVYYVDAVTGGIKQNAQ